MKETDIQSAIIDYLQIQENLGMLFFQRINNIPVSMMRNGKRVFRSMPKGSKKGFPDILVIKQGKCIGVEVKAVRGQISEAQKKVKEYFESNGAEYHIVRSVEEVQEIIEKFEKK